jgi:hypothetical protein
MSVCVVCYSRVPMGGPCPKCEKPPSAVDAVDAFILLLALSGHTEREMMITYLRSKVCILCGAPDPDCECYLVEEAIPS